MAFRLILKRFNPVVINTCRNYSSGDKLVETKLNESTGITTIILNRKPVNSLNTSLLSQLVETVQNLANSNIKGVILTSSLPNVFSAGLDFMELYKPTEEKFTPFFTALQETWLQFYGLEIPTVAAINGHAPAGGCLLALCCEYRIMLPNYTIGLNETKLGIIPPPWLQASMKNVIGARQAEFALTTGRLFTTDEALKISLIDEVASDKADLMQKAENYLNRFAKISPAARNRTKTSFRAEEIKKIEKTREEDLQMFWTHLRKPFVQEGLGKYIEGIKKKSPK